MLTDSALREMARNYKKKGLKIDTIHMVLGDNDNPGLKAALLMSGRKRIFAHPPDYTINEDYKKDFRDFAIKSYESMRVDLTTAKIMGLRGEHYV